jgi:hypothetical protein
MEPDEAVPFQSTGKRTVNNRHSLDRLSTLLAALTIVPGFFVAGIIYAGLFRVTSISGVFLTALIATGVCFAPAVFAIRGIFRLVLLIIGRIGGFNSSVK